MCIIAACYQDRLTEDMIQQMILWNSDGFGMAWIENGKAHWAKGLDFKRAVLYAARLPLPYVAHARLATVGGDTPKLAHPFPIERHPNLTLRGKAHKVLFHNGHVGYWKALVKSTDKGAAPILGKKWSDSRAIAHLLAGRDESDILPELTGNRFAVLSHQGVERYGFGWDQLDDVPSIWVSSPLHRAVNPALTQAYYPRHWSHTMDRDGKRRPYQGPWDD